jgi:AraC-like DNA-binding protein
MAVTVSVVSTRAVVEAAARRGVDPERILAPSGVSSALLADPDGRLPAEQIRPLWERAAAESGEPELAVRAAIELPWRSYRVLDYLAGSADTVGDALGLVARYFRIVHDTVRLTAAERSLRIERADGAPLWGPYVDYALAACVFRMTLVSEGPLHPEVHLRRPPPADRAGHVAAFGPNLHFAAPADEVRLSPAQWDRPTRDPDPVLREVLERHAEVVVQRLSAADPLADLRDAALQAMRSGRTDLGWVARRLDSSPRTLQRRLAEAGTSWSDLLEDLRTEAAKLFLRDPALSVDEVAVLLGYAEASTFHRAFRRWTGQSPGAWRRQAG